MKSRNRISLRNKIWITFFLMLFGIFSIYLLLGAPSLTIKMAYQKAVAGDAIREVRVIGTANIEEAGLEYDEILMAETMDKALLFGCRRGWNGWKEQSFLIQRIRKDDVTVMSVPGFECGFEEDVPYKLPVVIYGVPEEAAFVELEVQVQFGYTMDGKKEEGEVTFFGKWERKDDHPVVFFLEGDEMEEEMALSNLSRIMENNVTEEYPAKVTFYDKEKKRIQETVIRIQSPALEARNS